MCNIICNIHNNRKIKTKFAYHDEVGNVINYNTF